MSYVVRQLKTRLKRQSLDDVLAAAFPGDSFRGTIQRVEHHVAHLASAYYLSPWEPNFLPIADLDRLRPHDYQLCYWYCLEIEARARAYERDFAGAGVRLHAVDLEEIRDAPGIQELGRRLELGPMHPLWRLRLAASARTKNERDREKRGDELAPDRLDEWEAEVRDWVASGR